MSDEYDLAVAEMTEWVSDPHEFGVKPKHVEVLSSYFVEWPWHSEEQDIFLVKYELPDGRMGIGMSGPVTWSFSPDEVDFSKFEEDELVKLYAGWYMVFGLLNRDDYAPKFNPKHEREMVELLESDFGMTDVQVLDRILLGEETFYEISAVENGLPCRIAGSKDGSFACDEDDKFYCFPALYVFLGFAFFESDDDESDEEEYDDDQEEGDDE